MSAQPNGKGQSSSNNNNVQQKAQNNNYSKEQLGNNSSSTSSEITKQKNGGTKGLMEMYIDPSVPKASSSKEIIEDQSVATPSQIRSKTGPQKSRIPFQKPKFGHIPSTSSAVVQMGSEVSKSAQSVPNYASANSAKHPSVNQQNGRRSRSSIPNELRMDSSGDVPPPKRLRNLELSEPPSGEEGDQMQIDGIRSYSVLSTSSIGEELGGKLIQNLEQFVHEIIALREFREKHKRILGTISYKNLDDHSKERYDELCINKDNQEQIISDRKHAILQQFKSIFNGQSNERIEAIASKIETLQLEMRDFAQEPHPSSVDVQNGSHFNAIHEPSQTNAPKEVRVKREGDEELSRSAFAGNGILNPSTMSSQSMSAGLNQVENSRPQQQIEYAETGTFTDGIPLTELIASITRKVENEVATTFQNLTRILMRQDTEKNREISMLKQQLMDMDKKYENLHQAFLRNQGVLQEHREIFENHTIALKRHETFVQGTTTLFEQVPRVKGDYGPPMHIASTIKFAQSPITSPTIPQTSPTEAARQVQLPNPLPSSIPTVPSSHFEQLQPQSHSTM